MGSQRVLALVDEDTEASRRRAPRTRVLMSCLLVTTTDEYRVKLRNLSATGAMMEGAKLPPTGVDVILSRGATEIFATVAWADGSRGGLHFDEPLDDWENWTRAPLPVVQAIPIEVPGRRAYIGPVALSAEEEAIARTWANPVGRQGFGE